MFDSVYRILILLFFNLLFLFFLFYLLLLLVHLVETVAERAVAAEAWRPAKYFGVLTSCCTAASTLSLRPLLLRTLGCERTKEKSAENLQFVTQRTGTRVSYSHLHWVLLIVIN